MDKVLFNDVTISGLAIAIAVLLFWLVLARLVTFYLKKFLRDKFSRDRQENIAKVVNYILISVGLLIAFGMLGFDLSGIMVAGGVAGFIVGFASQRIIGNLISGLFMIIERPIRIGDQVEINGTIGIVDDVKMIATIIHSFDGLYHRIPNETVFNSEIINYVSNVVRRFEYIIGIRYSDDAQVAIAAIKEVIDNYPLALIMPAPQIFVDELADNSVNIRVRIWGPSTEWYTMKMELLARIKTAIEEAGIQIPFPQRVVWFAKETNDAPPIE